MINVGAAALLVLSVGPLLIRIGEVADRALRQARLLAAVGGPGHWPWRAVLIERIGRRLRHLDQGTVVVEVVGLGPCGPHMPLFAIAPLSIRYNATMPVVSGLLAFSNRYIGLVCSGLKGLTCARFIGFVAV
jgi:hypothetical protein